MFPTSNETEIECMGQKRGRFIGAMGKNYRQSITLEVIAREIMQISPNKWNDIYNAIIRLAQECMGWDG